MNAYVAPEDLTPHVDSVVQLIRERQTSFRVTYFRDIAVEHHKVWLIEDFLGEGEFTVFYGLPGCGKSVLIGDGAAHVATGRPWFGRRVTKGVVLYIAAERATLVKRRLAAWRKRHKVDDAPVVVVDGIFDLCHDRAHADELVRIANLAAEDFGLPVVWIIIDTKAQVLGGGDPNSDQEIGGFNGNVRVLQEGTGAHITVVDHVPHTSPDRMKGSGALAGAADGSFLVKNEGHARTVLIGSKPPNDGPDELDLRFKLESEELGHDAYGKATKAPVVVALADQTAGIPDHDTPLAGGRKMRPEQVLILRAYGLLIDAQQGRRVPPLPGVPPGTLGVSRLELRKRTCEIGFAGGDDNPETVKRSFNREIGRLIAGNVLREEGDLVWRVR